MILKLLLLLLPLLLFSQEPLAFLQKADNGDKEAQLKAARYYEQKGKTADALYWYKKAALNKTAAYNLKNTEFKKDPKGMSERVVKNVTSNAKDEAAKGSILQLLTSNFALHPYKSNYFMPISYDFKQKDDSRKQFESKFQLSFLIPLSKNYFGYKEAINLAYTQQSWWQTAKDSSPFRETNYQPELFVTLPIKLESLPNLHMLQGGFMHRSNGQSGLESRSLNALYLKAFLHYENLFLNLHTWYRIPEEKKDYPTDPKGDDNPNYIDYYGSAEVELQYFIQKHLLHANYRYSLAGLDKGSITLGWSFPISKDIFGCLNYFHGYGESLIDYDKKVQRLGFGLQFTR